MCMCVCMCVRVRACVRTCVCDATAQQRDTCTLREVSLRTIARTATLSQELQAKRISPSHSILTPGQPVLLLNLQSQASGRIAARMPTLSLQCHSSEEGGDRPPDLPHPRRKRHHLATEAPQPRPLCWILKRAKPTTLGKKCSGWQLNVPAKSNPGSSALEADALTTDRLVGLVVKASASRAEDPRFESRLRRDFSGAESYQ